MKTAISVPDDTYARATQRARDLGISRSQFFTVAAARYLDELDNQSLTHQIDEVVDALGDDAASTDTVDAGRRMLGSDSGEW